MRVAIAKAGLAEHSCAKYLNDAGHTPVILESRNVTEDWVAAWQHEYFQLIKILENLSEVNWQRSFDRKRRVELDGDRSMRGFIIAGIEDWLNQFVSKILQATAQLQKLFWTHWGKDNAAHLLKRRVVLTLRQKYYLGQTPIHNFYLSKSNTMQPYLGSMEGAVLSGKLTAQAITAHQSAPNSLQMQNIQPATNAATA